VTDLAFSPSDNRFASASEDLTARLWYVGQSALTPIVLDGHLRPVKRVKFAPTGQLLLTTSWDGNLRIWDIPSGDRLLAAARASMTRCTTVEQAQMLGLTASTDAQKRALSHVLGMSCRP